LVGYTATIRRDVQSGLRSGLSTDATQSLCAKTVQKSLLSKIILNRSACIEIRRVIGRILAI